MHLFLLCPRERCEELPSVCLSVCLHISETTCPNFAKFCVSPVAVAWSSCDDSAICYVSPVLWMTSCFHIIRHVLYGETYGRGMSVSGRQRRRRASAFQISASLRYLPLTPSTISIAVHSGVWLWRPTIKRHLLIALFSECY